MKVIEVQFTPWGKTYDFSGGDCILKINDSVIVKTELGTEIGKVIGIKEVDDHGVPVSQEIKPIFRKANNSDYLKIKERNNQRKEALSLCKKLVRKYNLSIKLVDVHFAFDGSRITFAFVADGRVDFRELVKELTRIFQKSIRMQQLGIRDEAKISGDVGCCGRGLCCKNVLRDLGNITSDLASLQQISHRGSDRLTGICGRLMCCLAYEQKAYEELAKNLPAVGTIVKTKSGKGKIIGWHTLKQSVMVELDEGGVIEVEIKKS